MTRLTATTRPVDQARAARAILAWNSGDRLALDAVLGEAMADPIGTPGLLFELVGFGATLIAEIDPSGHHLRARLFELASEDDAPNAGPTE